MHRRITFIFWFVFLFPGVLLSQPQEKDVESSLTATLQGKVLEKGTKKPLPQINLYLLPYGIQTRTNDKGEFQVEAPLGSFTWVVNVPGYQKLEKGDIARSDDSTDRTLYVERVRYEGVFETTIVGKQNKREVTRKSVDLEEIMNVPGAGRDPIKAVQNLPGINRVAGFDSNIVIQGSEENSTSYLIDGHEVPFVFHFAGLSTVVFPESIERVDYLSAGYGPEYGRALGGLVGVKTRDPRRDRLRGMAFVDLINAGGLVEGGVTENSGFLFSFRQSYIGEVLSAIVGNDEDFNFTVAPRYTDVTAIYDWRVSDTTKFKITGIGSLDAVEFLLEDPVNNDPALRGKFENETNFFRLIPQLEVTHSDTLESRWSVGVGWTDFRIETDENLLSLEIWSFTPKAEMKWEVAPTLDLFVGTDNEISLTKADVLLNNSFEAGGVFNPFSSGEEVFVDVLQPIFELGQYVRPMYRPEGTPWTFSPGARLDYFSETDSIHIDPRVSVTYDLDPSLRLRASGGRYHQSPEPQESNEDAGNPNIEAPSAWHLAVGADKDFRGGSTLGWTASTGAFFRWFEGLIVSSNQTIVENGNIRPEFFNNSGSGRSYGGETSIKYAGQEWNAQLAYTLLRSRREEPAFGEYRAAFDQTHNVNLIAGVDLPRNWRISTRIRYVTGNPFTPVVAGVYDSDNNVFIPIRGPLYSDRLAPFFQTDVRIDKKWIFDTWILSLYLDIQNATNRKNPEMIDYAYDFSESTTLNGLPIIPSFGLKGEF